MRLAHGGSMYHSNQDLKDARALVIDGSAASRNLLMGQLRSLGVVDIVACARVEDARRKLEVDTFDLVLCEQRFEKEPLTGQGLIDELRRHQLLPFHTVFIILTSEATHSKVVEAAEAALDAYIIKPHTVAVLSERIHAARARKRALEDIFSAIEVQSFDEAIELCLKRFRARADFWVHAARIAAELYIRTSRLREAQALFEEVCAASDQPWARLGVARVQFDAGQFAKALSTLEALIEQDKRYADAFDLMGRIHFEQGHFEQALSTFSVATKLTPTAVGRLLKQGMLGFYAGDRKASIDALERAAYLGRETKLFDPQAYVLLAFHRFDRKDHRGLQHCGHELNRLAERSHEPERMWRLSEMVAALTDMFRGVTATAINTANQLMADVQEPHFDVETACNLLCLLDRMQSRDMALPDAQACVESMALRFGTSRAMSELMACAAGEQEGWMKVMRDGHTQIIHITEQAMRMSLKGDPAGTVEQLLRDAERTSNAKLIEAAHQVMQRHAARIEERDALKDAIRRLRERFPLSKLRLGDQTGAMPGAMALPMAKSVVDNSAYGELEFSPA